MKGMNLGTRTWLLGKLRPVEGSGGKVLAVVEVVVVGVVVVGGEAHLDKAFGRRRGLELATEVLSVEAEVVCGCRVLADCRGRGTWREGGWSEGT